MTKMEEFYEKRYKLLLIIPLLLLIFSVIFMINFYSKTGDIMNKDVSLKGGISAAVYLEEAVNVEEIENSLRSEFGDSEVFVRSLAALEEDQNGFIVEAGGEVDDVILEEKLENLLDIELNDENFFVQVTSSRLGEDFYRQMIRAIIFAFVFMAIVIVITFRSFVPSLLVILSVVFDIFITLVVIDLIGLRISAAGIAALLLLIGYSVDSDILLTTRVIKRREGRVWERFVGSAKTGLTMTFTTLAALILGYIFSTSFVLKEMFLIIIIGLIIDIISTYIMNASLLKWYVNNRREKYE